MMENNKNMINNETAASPAAAPAKPKKPTMQDEADALFALEMRVADQAKGLSLHFV